MPDLTVESISTPEGYDFIRSDGQRFYLVGTSDGHAVLHAGRRAKPPTVRIVDIDVSVPDKLEAARQWVLAYPKHPGNPA